MGRRPDTGGKHDSHDATAARGRPGSRGGRGGGLRRHGQSLAERPVQPGERRSGQHQDARRQFAERPVGRADGAARRPRIEPARERNRAGPVLRLRRRRADLLPAPAASGRSRRPRPSPTRTPTSSFDGQKGADPSYDYGTHFLFQGHEGGHARGYITRINLDADVAHRVTLMATQDRHGARPARHRRLDLGSVRHSACSSPPRTAGGRRRLAGDARLPVEGRRRSPASSAGRLRGRPERLRRQRLDRRGRRRPSTARRPARQAAEQLRLPLRAEGQGPT